MRRMHRTAMVAGLAAWAATAAATPDWINARWAADPLWDDGKAEVCEYDATTSIYGKPRAHHTTMIVVKEDFGRGQFVKSDNPGVEPGGALQVLKLALVSERIPTENYDYDYAATLFVERADPSRCVRAVVTSHEWCGISFKEFQGWREPPRVRLYSYWDGEGSRELDAPAGSVPRESLLVALRAMDFSKRAEVEALQPWLDTRARKPEAERLTARADDAGTVTVAAGAFDCHRVTVEKQGAPEPAMTLWIEKAFPNRIIRAAMPGSEMELRNSRRWAYWMRQ